MKPRRRAIRYSCFEHCLTIRLDKLVLTNPIRNWFTVSAASCTVLFPMTHIAPIPGFAGTLELDLRNPLSLPNYSTTPTTYGSPVSNTLRRRMASLRAAATMAFFLLLQFPSTRRNLSSNT